MIYSWKTREGFAGPLSAYSVIDLDSGGEVSGDRIFFYDSDTGRTGRYQPNDDARRPVEIWETRRLEIRRDGGRVSP